MLRFVVMLSFLTLFSCATTMGDRREKLPVTSSPTGAQATLTCTDGTTTSGVTPAILDVLVTAGDCQLHIAKDGYETKTVAIGRGMNGAFWGNFGFIMLAPLGAFVALDDRGNVPVGIGMMLGAAVPFYVDYRSGAMRRHEPNSVDVVLTRKP